MQPEHLVVILKLLHNDPPFSSGQGAPFCKFLRKTLEVLFRRKFSGKKKKYHLVVTETPALFKLCDYFSNIIATIKKFTDYRFRYILSRAFFIGNFIVTDYCAFSGNTDNNTGPVRISKAQFHILLPDQFRGEMIMHDGKFFDFCKKIIHNWPPIPPGTGFTPGRILSTLIISLREGNQ